MENVTQSRRKILGATAIAAGVALLLLVSVILPAEYGIDPLRTGRALGLTELANPQPPSTAATATPPPTASSARPAGSGGLKHDLFEVELRPYEGVEYKYPMTKGASMVYSWTATDKLAFEFHGDPEGAAKGVFDSYEKSEGSESQGTLVAPTTGVHGWFWENKSAARVKIRLVTSGFYGDATEYRDGSRIVHNVTVR